MNLLGGGAVNGRWGAGFGWLGGTWAVVRFSASIRNGLAHNGKVRLQPQHSTEVPPQQPDADHEAFLSLAS
jgi:hypothetical protein